MDWYLVSIGKEKIMNKKFKKMTAAVMAVATLAVGMTGMSASAAVNKYSTLQTYKSGSNVYFGATAKNLKNSSSDFYYAGQLYNITTGGFINSVSDIEYDVGKNIQVTMRGSRSYSSLPDSTKCVNNVRAYANYSQYASPYETYSNNSYYYK